MKLPPVRKRPNYSGVRSDDLAFALFYDRLLNIGAMQESGEVEDGQKTKPEKSAQTPPEKRKP